MEWSATGRFDSSPSCFERQQDLAPFARHFEWVEMQSASDGRGRTARKWLGPRVEGTRSETGIEAPGLLLEELSENLLRRLK